MILKLHYFWNDYIWFIWITLHAFFMTLTTVTKEPNDNDWDYDHQSSKTTNNWTKVCITDKSIEQKWVTLAAKVYRENTLVLLTTNMWTTNLYLK